MNELVVAIIGAAGVIIAAIAIGAKGYIAAWFEDRKKRIGQRDNYLGMVEVAQLYQICDTLVREEFVDRILLFTGSNGGGVPKAGSPYFVTATAGYSNQPGVHPERAYSGRLPVDGHYIGLLLECIKTGSVVCTPSEMPDKAYLRAYYEKEHVVQSVMHFLKLDSKELIYFSAANYSRKFTPPELAKIEMAAAMARGLMKTTLPILD
jgi:hypothetical protein